MLACEHAPVWLRVCDSEHACAGVKNEANTECYHSLCGPCWKDNLLTNPRLAIFPLRKFQQPQKANPVIHKWDHMIRLQERLGWNTGLCCSGTGNKKSRRGFVCYIWGGKASCEWHVWKQDDSPVSEFVYSTKFHNSHTSSTWNWTSLLRLHNWGKLVDSSGRMTSTKSVT